MIKDPEGRKEVSKGVLAGTENVPAEQESRDF